MKHNKTPFNLLALCLLGICYANLYGQEAKTTLNAPDKLNRLLETKISLDQKMSKRKQFTIQVHYGNYESTTTVLAQFKEKFPLMSSRIIFETPNYKIRSGSFATEREALEVLNIIKRKFPSAFVLKP